MRRCVPCRIVIWETDKNAPKYVNSVELVLISVVVLGTVLAPLTVEGQSNLDWSNVWLCDAACTQDGFVSYTTQTYMWASVTL